MSVTSGRNSSGQPEGVGLRRRDADDRDPLSFEQSAGYLEKVIVVIDDETS